MRPWEYFNEVIGGTKNGYLYFSDEGVGLGQRGKEFAAYYHRALEPVGEVPLLDTYMYEPEEKARHLDWLGRDKNRDEARLASPIFSGTILADGNFLGEKPYWDTPDLRHATPTARFGNLLVFRGTFNCSGIFAQNLYFDALSKIYAEKPDLEEADQLLRQSIRLDPKEFFADIELGNVGLKRGLRENALYAFSDALHHAPNDPELVRSLEEQIRRVSSEPLGQVPELRDPFLE
jgi:tetratricopeptide (TPR) repeat protein